MSTFPTGEAGLINTQQMLLTYLNQTGTPQTGDSGVVNIQNLMQQVLSGAGGGGMVPPGSTGIGAFTTNGTTVPATYNSTTGALNIPNYPGQQPPGSTGISTFTTSGTGGPSSYSSSAALNVPVYASGTLNMQRATLATQFVTSVTSFATAVSIGLGVPLTAQINPCVCLDYGVLNSVSVTSTITAVGIYRTTGIIPPASANPPGGDVFLCQTRQINLLAAGSVLTGTFLDTTLSVGTAYNYYIVAWINSGSGTMTMPVSTTTALCAFEVK